MATLDTDQLADAARINEAEARLNALLAQAGDIADTLSSAGYDVFMHLWSATAPGSTIRGRLQGNVAKATIKVATKRP